MAYGIGTAGPPVVRPSDGRHYFQEGEWLQKRGGAPPRTRTVPVSTKNYTGQGFVKIGRPEDRQMGNRDIAKLGSNGTGVQGELLGEDLRLLKRVQGRIERYYDCLGRDLEFDVRVAQKAEQEMLRRLVEVTKSNKLRSRDIRQNLLAVGSFRRRTHDSLVRVAEVIRAREQTNIQVNFGEKPIEDEELYEAMGVLSEAGVVDGEVVTEVLSMEGDSDAVREEGTGRYGEEGELSGEGGSEAPEAEEGS